MNSSAVTGLIWGIIIVFTINIKNKKKKWVIWILTYLTMVLVLIILRKLGVDID